MKSTDSWRRYSLLTLAGAIFVLNPPGHCGPLNVPACCVRAEPAASALPDKSLYQVQSRWTTDRGKQIQLADLKGCPQVIVMFFASCQSACPVLVQDLRRIEAALEPNQRARVGFTLVTIDPSRDKPEALAGFRAARALPVENWNLLYGSPDDIQQLAALLGVKYKEQANGQFAHSNLITVLNQEGEIVHQLAGLGEDSKSTVRVLRQLLMNETPHVSPAACRPESTPVPTIGP